MSHVVQVIPGIDRIGGAEQQVITLAGGFVRRGWKSTVVSLSGTGGDAARELRAAGVEFLSLGMRKGLADPRGWLRLRRWLLENSPDVVHAHLPHAVWLARVVRLLTPVRVIVDTLHSASTGSAARRALYRMTGGLADCVSAVSRPVAEAGIAARMAPAGKVVIVPNGVDTCVWRPGPEAGARLRAEMGIADRFLWIAAGRLEAVKDHATLLKAFAGLPEQAHLVIAGAGPLEPELRGLAIRLEVDARVRFLGFTSDILRWMQGADACVLASRCEGLPICLLEAGACALPCVATNVAGSNEVLVDGVTGFLAGSGDAESQRRAMLRLMQMAPASRRALGINARQRIEKQFSLESVLDRWEQLYTDLLDRRPLPSRSGHSFQERPFSGLKKSHAG